MKVCAICTKTGLEVSIVGDIKATKDELNRIATQKLHRMKEKKNPKPLESTRGIIV
ncbi:hypothetical protein QGN29_11750 [Temperatibacter marinus]|uniref:DUF6898 domain-containing protein n=1 Tax=Temperatibacter marinus TaxID=1456591 RepID=A0AA52HA04_9PROT|nr:hypothetical protein [Temperatibacter marinus]WND02225.1 hypothetical protein QGN29_11750 [Temperatibacter marinus]